MYYFLVVSVWIDVFMIANVCLDRFIGAKSTCESIVAHSEDGIGLEANLG